jgi:urea transport system permease protein
MLALGLIGWLLTLTPLAADEAVSPRSLTNQLAGASSDDKLRIARALTAHDEGVAVIELLARGALFLDRRTGQVVAGERRGARYRLSDVFSDAALGEGGRRDVRRLKVDNALREQLQNLLAIAALTDPQPAQRAQAIAAILAAPTPATLAALAARADDEPEAALRDEIAVGLALADLASTDAAVVARGLETLRRSSRDSVRTALRGVAGRADLPAALRDRAARQLAAAERRLAWAARAESLFFGLSLGSVLLLSAVGLAITFGVMGVINMAHGELIMLGAYTAWLLQQWLPAQPGVALLLAIPAAFLVSGLIGLAIERGVIRHLYGRPLETLLATFGISLILQQAVRSLFSPLNPRRGHAGLAERRLPLARPRRDLESPGDPVLFAARVRGAAAVHACAHATGSRGARGGAEPRPWRGPWACAVPVSMPDLRTRFRCRRCCRRRPVAADQRRSEPRPGVHH